MKKRILALALALVLILGMIPSVGATGTEKAQLVLTADKTTAVPGDVITYTLSLGAVAHLQGFEMTLQFPAELSYVDNSAKIPDGLAATLGTAQPEWTESTMVYAAYGNGDYTGTDAVDLLTFQCRVAATAGTGTYVPSLADVVLADSYYEEIPYEINDTNGKIGVVIKVQGVSLNVSTLNLNTGSGNTATLTASIDPEKATDKSVTWKSSDETVAAVSDTGVVTALKKGTAVITVTTTDGGFTANCTVTVACAHINTTDVPAETSTCQKQGNNAYTKCDDCGEVIVGSDEKLPIGSCNYIEKTENQHLVSEATCIAKAVYYKSCSVCGAQNTETFEAGDYSAHKMGTEWITVNNKHYHECTVDGCVHIEDEAFCSGGTATCTAKAVCSKCNREYGNLLEHTLTHHEPEAADHTKPGNIEYWVCNSCEKYFADASAKNEIQQADTVIPQIPHSHGAAWEQSSTQHWNECSCGDKINVYDHLYDNACDTTCNTCGYTRTITHTWETELSYDADQHWTKCSVCGEKKDVENHHGGTATCQNRAVCVDCGQPYGELTGCDFTAEKAEPTYLQSAANCKNAAIYYKSCAVCGKAGTDTFVHGEANLSNHVHTEVRNQVDGTCTSEGYTGDIWCNDCNEKIGAGLPIVVEHELAKVEANAATHDADGNTAYYVCRSCRQLFADAQATEQIEQADTVVPKGEHEYTTQSDNTNHWKECDCGSEIEKESHTYGEWVTTQDSGVDVTGSRERVCSSCGYKQTEKIPATHTPATGDATQPQILFAILLFSACGIIATVCLGSRKKGKYQR